MSTVTRKPRQAPRRPATEQLVMEHADTYSDQQVSDSEERRLLNAAERIRLSYKGVRVQVSSLSQSRKVQHSQKKEAAQLFQASEDSISMSSMLWNAKEPLVKDVRSVLNAIGRAWHDRSKTMKTATDGIRRIKRDCVAELHKELLRLSTDLGEKALALKIGLPAIIERQREIKGRLFNAVDYENFDPVRDISVKWSFPVVNEDSELAELDDSVYQHELGRVRQEGMLAVKNFEDELAELLVTMLDEIAERLEGTEGDGRRKKFKDSTPLKIFGELEMFNTQLKELGVGGYKLEQVFSKLGEVVAGQNKDTFPEALRRGPDEYRDTVRTKVTEIREHLLEQVVPVQRRKLLRNKNAKHRADLA